jgi:PKD repeat protein
MVLMADAAVPVSVRAQDQNGRDLSVRSRTPLSLLLLILGVLLLSSYANATIAGGSSSSTNHPALPSDAYDRFLLSPFYFSDGTTTGCAGGTSVNACASALWDQAHAAAPVEPASPAGTQSWTETCAACSPGLLQGDMMTYDYADGYVLLYGGYQCSTGTCASAVVVGATWTYSAGTWTEICASCGPGDRFDGGMVYDAADDYVVLWGGCSTAACAAPITTWTYHAGTWTQVAPTNHPTARYFPGMAWDPSDNYVLMYGGCPVACDSGTGYPVGDYWSYVGGQWTQLGATASAGTRSHFGMATDFADNEVVLYGGIQYNGGYVYLSDSWTFSAGTFTQVCSACGPGELMLMDDQLAYYTGAGYVTLFGGEDPGTGGYSGATWEFLGGTWTTLSPTASPDASGWSSLSDDPADCTVDYYDGWDGVTGTNVEEMWVMSDTSATPSVSLAAAPVTTDVTFPVTFTATPKCLTPPVTFTMRFGDGGTAVGNPLTHTYTTPGAYTVWVWANDSAGHSASAWTNVLINPLPSATLKATPNPTDVGVAVNFVALGTGGTGALTYAWHFADGGSSNLQDPSHTFTAPGTYPVRNWVNDTVGGSGTTIVSVLVNPPPSVVASANYAVADAGTKLQFNATVTGGTAPIAIAWEFGDGTAGVGSPATHAYAARGNYTARGWGNDSVGLTSTATASVTIEPALSVPILSASPKPTDVGIPVNFSASFWGGTPAFKFAWTFGDGGVSASLSATHTFGKVGTYSVRFWVNDSGGGTQSVNLSVLVNPDPQVKSFSGQSVVGYTGQIDLGMYLNGSVVLVSGTGTAPFSYSYSGEIPTGCTLGVTSLVSCVPTETGNYAIEVTVTDAALGVAHAWMNGTVHADPIVMITATPQNTTVNSGITFHIVDGFGTGPLTLNFSGAPPGCTSLNSTWLNCTVSSTGTFTVHVTATDLWNKHATAYVVLQISNQSIFGEFDSEWPWLLLLIACIAIAAVCLILYARRRRAKRQAEEAGLAAGGMMVAGGAGEGGAVMAGGEGYAPSPEGVMAPPEGPLMTSDGYPVEPVAPGPPPQYTSDGYPMEPVAPGPPPDYAPAAPPPTDAAGYPAPPPGYAPPDAGAPPPQVTEVPRDAAPPTTQWVAVPVAPAAGAAPAASPPPSGPSSEEFSAASAPPPPPAPAPSPQMPPAAPPPAPEGRPGPTTCVLCGNPMGPDGRCGTCGWAPAH